MTEPVSTKLTMQQKKNLEYLAARQHKKKANLIRAALMKCYNLDSETLTRESNSFFVSDARLVAHD